MALPLVLDLQKKALDHSILVSELLRTALAVAIKLKLAEFEKWIQLELNGYEKDRLPDYRVAHGTVMASDPYRGWIPVMFSDPQMAELVSKGGVPNSIAELEHLLKTPENGALQLYFPPEQEALLVKNSAIDARRYCLFLDRTSLRGIVERVRNIVLNWSLTLEKDRVLGDEISFSENEKQIAQKAIYNIGTYISVGSMDHSILQQGAGQGNQSASISNTLDELRDFIPELRKALANFEDNESRAIASAQVATIEAQLSSPKPVSKIIYESLCTLRNLAEGTAASLMASALWEKIPYFIDQVHQLLK